MKSKQRRKKEHKLKVKKNKVLSVFDKSKK